MQAERHQGAEEEARSLRVRPRRTPGPRRADRSHRPGVEVSIPVMLSFSKIKSYV